MEAILHKANTRGHMANDWLESWHTFSFGTYHDPTRMHFGALRVLNDNTVVPGGSFGTPGHHNMEVITIPLQGSLQHKDSLGNDVIIQQGDVQVLSTGTGSTHAEINPVDDQFLRFLQLWITPSQQQVTPRYEQQTFDLTKMHNRLQTVVSPMGSAEGVNIYQNVWISLGQIERGNEVEYSLHQPTNGIYILVLEGDVMANEFALNRRDGLGLLNKNKVRISADTNAEVILIEVPMLALEEIE